MLAFKLMTEEQAVTLSMPEGTNLTEYANLLIERFSNPSIKHETWQIATDGSQKLPQRMCESLRFHIQNDTATPCLILGVAGWMVYVSEQDEQGNKIIVNDPMLAQFREAYENAKTSEEIVMSLLALNNIFGEDLIKNTTFVNALVDAVQQLKTIGAKALVAKML
ncbi:hypothetical protein ACLKMH_04840 [Psychromonas sp. KJ10-10]|uniref:mannitol dehydrogenase family protein n=1 Tax=Psychromonas sp. KJ10-10 TaxID=3391823 RepID=UPI0039B5956E